MSPAPHPETPANHQLTLAPTVTRSHKFNDRDHSASVLADGSPPNDPIPRYFSKHGHVDADPKKTKKDGGGKGNWGRPADELQDGAYNLANPRRRSNSTTERPDTFRTKFETVDPEPVFEEDVHGDGGEDHYADDHAKADASGHGGPVGTAGHDGHINVKGEAASSSSGNGSASEMDGSSVSSWGEDGAGWTKV